MSVRRLAVIDLGTNSARLAFLEIPVEGVCRIIAGGRIPCRLGEGLADTGELGAAACERSLRALTTLAAQALESGAERTCVVGTYALRTARNAAAFLSRARSLLDIEIRVLSGVSEARLVLEAVRRRAVGAAPGSLVCLDLGGGSLELAREHVPDPILVSLPLGAVLTLAALSVPASPAAVAQLRRRAAQLLDEQAQDFSGSTSRPPFAAGGTVTTAARLLPGTDPEGRTLLPSRDLEALLQQLAPLDLAARRRVPGLDPDRADIIVSGLAVLCETLRFLGAEALRVHEHGVREGVLLAMLEGRM